MVDVNWHNRGYDQTGQFDLTIQQGVTSAAIIVQHVKLSYRRSGSGVVEVEDINTFGIPQNQGVIYDTGQYFKIYFYYVNNSFILVFEVPGQSTYNTSERSCVVDIDYTYNTTTTTTNFGVYIYDTWGPTVYYVRRNESSRISEVVTNVNVTESTSSSPASGEAEIHEFGDFYYLIYKFTKYKEQYTLSPYLKSVTYSGHNLLGWTQGLYNQGYTPPYVFDSSDIDLPNNSTMQLPYLSQVGFGAVWRENSCPTIYEIFSNQWVPALSISVKDEGVWKTPTAIYTYIEGRGWVQAPPSG